MEFPTSTESSTKSSTNYQQEKLLNRSTVLILQTLQFLCGLMLIIVSLKLLYTKNVLIKSSQVQNFDFLMPTDNRSMMIITNKLIESLPQKSSKSDYLIIFYGIFHIFTIFCGFLMWFTFFYQYKNNDNINNESNRNNCNYIQSPSTSSSTKKKTSSMMIISIDDENKLERNIISSVKNQNQQHCIVLYNILMIILFIFNIILFIILAITKVTITNFDKTFIKEHLRKYKLFLLKIEHSSIHEIESIESYELLTRQYYHQLDVQFWIIFWLYFPIICFLRKKIVLNFLIHHYQQDYFRPLILQLQLLIISIRRQVKVEEKETGEKEEH